MRLVTFLLLLLMILFSLGGSSCDNPKQKKSIYTDLYCNGLSHDIDEKIREFRISKDSNLLLQAMLIEDTAINNCEGKGYFIKSKVLLFQLLKDYQQGINFIMSLNDSVYNESYEKMYFLKTLYSLQSNEKNDTLSRNKYNQEIISYMESLFELKAGKCEDIYVLIDYYLVKARLENKVNLVDEINKISLEDSFKNEVVKQVQNFDMQVFYKQD